MVLLLRVSISSPHIARHEIISYDDLIQRAEAGRGGCHRAFRFLVDRWAEFRDERDVTRVINMTQHIHNELKEQQWLDYGLQNDLIQFFLVQKLAKFIIIDGVGFGDKNWKGNNDPSPFNLTPFIECIYRDDWNEPYGDGAPSSTYHYLMNRLLNSLTIYSK
jgi:hypothetical protein